MTIRKARPLGRIAREDPPDTIEEAALDLEAEDDNLISMEEAARETSAKLQRKLGHPVRHEPEFNTRELRLLESLS